MKLLRLVPVVLLLAFCVTANADELPEEVKKVLTNISPSVGYKYFSGNYENSHNNPAIFAYGYKEKAKLVVTGRGFYKEYSINEWSKAMEAYKAILIVRGYEPAN